MDAAPSMPSRFELIAVFPDPGSARAAAQDLRAAGTDRDAVQVDESFATLTRGEMEEELDHSWAGSLIGVFVTDEQARPALVLAVVLGAIGAVVGAVFTVWLSSVPVTWWGRALVGAAVGGTLLGTVGAVVGGGMGSRHVDEDVPFEGGAAVRVADEPGAVARLRRCRPLRIDRFADGQFIESLRDETAPAAERLGRGLTDPTAR